ncbi:hypothetical protein [Lewinella cohaerens]|uniref:hypothetical protein n=1 Tax=Lewinella cohaerens TaxID=70995 RepID=UPI00035EC045|nr:hypothetical protein [Lewinella cohaerens]
MGPACVPWHRVIRYTSYRYYPWSLRPLGTASTYVRFRQRVNIINVTYSDGAKIT